MRTAAAIEEDPRQSLSTTPTIVPAKETGTSTSLSRSCVVCVCRVRGDLCAFCCRAYTVSSYGAGYEQPPLPPSVVKDDSGYEYQSQGSDASSGQASSDNYAFFKYVTPTLPTLSHFFCRQPTARAPLSAPRARASFLSSSLPLFSISSFLLSLF